MYRAKTIDTKRVVTGFWCVVNHKHYIILDDANFVYHKVQIDPIGPKDSSAIMQCLTDECFVEIDPSTLAQDTTIKDKHGTPIFGSFEVEGKMTEGGDIVKGHEETGVGHYSEILGEVYLDTKITFYRVSKVARIPIYHCCLEVIEEKQ